MLPRNVSVMKYKRRLGNHTTLKETKQIKQLKEMHNFELSFAKKKIFGTNGTLECLWII